MIAEVLGTFSSSVEAENAVVRIKRAGVRTSDIAVVEGDREIDFALSMKRGVGWGALLGTLMGGALVLYSGSTAFNNWGGMLSIPISGAFGWALYGLILGGSGLLAGPVKTAPAVLALELTSPNEVETVTTVLYEAGALNVRAFEPVAA